MKLKYVRKYSRSLSTMLLIIFFSTLIPPQIFAITSGPAQEEFASFEPAQTTEMVNLYSGNFTYNIPLMSIPGPNGGYPINLFYDGGTNLNNAGSWVGLGWNLNIGSVSRQLRGIPDDFSGELVKQEMSLKNYFGFAVDIPTSGHQEIAGFPVSGSPISWQPQLYYNNYKGLGYRISTSLGVRGASGLGASVGLSFDAQNGIGIDPSVSLAKEFGNISSTLSLGTSFNSRQGLQRVALNTNFSYQKKWNEVNFFLPYGVKLGFSSGAGISGTSSLSFGFSGTVPTVEIPSNSTNIEFDLKLGNELFPLFSVQPWGKWSGNFEWSKLDKGGIDFRPAYGYLHSHKDIDRKGLRDFNRSSLPYSKKISNLAPSTYSFDQLIVTGTGLQGMFRPFRSQVEVLNTPERTSRTSGHRINLEFGGGLGIHASAGYTNTTGKQYSGIWRDHGKDDLPIDIDANILDPKSVHAANVTGPDYEPSFYRLFGEQTGVKENEPNQLRAWNGNTALRPELEKGKPFETTGKFVNEKKGLTLNPTNLNNVDKPAYAAIAKRTPKANVIQTLTAKESRDFGFSHNMKIYEYDQTNYPENPDYHFKFDNGADEDSEQISEINVTKRDGLRYIYGLPAKNTKQVDAIFNVFPPYTLGGTNLNGGAGTDVIDASSVTTNSKSRQYSSKTTLPDYAHSWLLTHIVSTDYADLTGDGMSADDPGSWMKFEYVQVTDDNNKYKWREPYEYSNFIEGKKSDATDDMAAYTYGEKDLYYLSRMETATHIAIFDIEERKDAVGVQNEAQGKRDNSVGTTNKMYKLNAIKLYAKENGVTPTDFTLLTPLQTIVFGYAADGNDELCIGIPSAPTGRGKLTLKEIYLTTDHSTKGSLSPYQFDYGPMTDDTFNPRFHRRNKDRWGNYQENMAYVNNGFVSVYGDDYPFVDFPYTNQYDPPNVDAWQLQKITLPTGGEIVVDYESDDYAYEMDKPAAQMFDIIGLDSEPNAFHDRYADGNKVAKIDQGSVNEHYKVYVGLTTPIPDDVSDQDEYFRKHYLEGIDHIYFKIFSQLKDGGSKKQRDYVTGYAKLLADNIGQYGVSNSDPSIAYFTLEQRPVQKPSFGVNIHPFRRATLEHLRANRPELVYGYDQNESSPNNIIDQVKELIGTIGTFFEELSITSKGFNRHGVDKDWAEKIYLNGKSIVRLNNGSGFMYGGGNRVKSVKLNNKWTHGAGEDEYGQTFDYTIEEEGRTISSGVAITPQSAGGDECGLLEPVLYESSTLLVSPHQLFIEKPIMKKYYPGPSVGYRKVMVSTLSGKIVDDDLTDGLTSADIDKGFTPVSIHEFYTHKDFPVIESETELSASTPAFHNIPLPFLGSKMKKHIGRSQGYSIELNNMAGVSKAVTQRTYPTADNPEGTLISKTEYIYNTEREYSPDQKNKLSNNVKLIDFDPSTGHASLSNTKNGIIGETYDIFHDFTENFQSSKQYGGDLNSDWLIFPPFIYWFTLLPAPVINTTETSLRTAVTHKIIYRTGVLEEVKITDGQSVLSTKNIAYDKLTANPVLTKTTNEFKDNIYNFTQPAYWHYDNRTVGSMAGAYRNIGITIEGKSVNSGIISGLSSQEASFFVRGDEVWTEGTDSDNLNDGGKYYVDNVDGDDISLIDEDGVDATFSGNRDITIIRSGRRNLLTAQASSKTYKGSIGDGDALITSQFNNRDDHVINTSVTTFVNEWDALYCDNYYTFSPSGCSITTVGTDLLNLMNAIAAPNIGGGGIIDIQDLTLNYSSYLTPALLNAMGTPNQVDYQPILNGNDLNFRITDIDCVDCFTCAVPMTQSSGINWTNVNSFSNLIPITNRTFSIEISDGNNTTTATTTMNIDCFNIGDCTSSGYVRENCGPPADGNGLSLNPFVDGVSGNWRINKSFAYKTNRVYPDDEPRLREHGTFGNTFNPFDWTMSDNQNEANGWVSSTRVSKYTPHGLPIEEEDALGIYSAAQYGYNKQLAIAVAANAELKEIGNENFEDYPKDCSDHFKFTFGSGQEITSNVVHTGTRSLELPPSSSPSFMIIKLDESENSGNKCIGGFEPKFNETYLMSGWVKETDANNQDLPRQLKHDNGEIQIRFADANGNTVNNGSFSFKASGKMIEGWQRVNETFNVPSDAKYLHIELINNAVSGTKVFMDDLRVHPNDSNMRSFVFNPKNFRVMSTLDENNYATYLIRDEQGQVVKYNVETEKGIVTLNEGTQHVTPQ